MGPSCLRNSEEDSETAAHSEQSNINNSDQVGTVSVNGEYSPHCSGLQHLRTHTHTHTGLWLARDCGVSGRRGERGSDVTYVAGAWLPR